MSYQRKVATTLLRQTRLIGTGLLVGNTIATPVLAATTVAIDDFSKPVLFGSLALLIVGLALKAKYGKKEPPTIQRDFNEGIGRYRPQLGRGNAY